jgi:hypothetical protein
MVWQLIGSGGFFFASEGEDCGEKPYTLTFPATAPEQLPAADDRKLKTKDRKLKQIIQEAIDLVDSID